MARAGLRLDGASPDLWAALGAVAAEVRCHEETKVVDACHADHQSRLLATPCEHVTTLPSASATPFHLQPSVREYALSRALQLDPKCVPAWVGLARLYAGGCAEGAREPVVRASVQRPGGSMIQLLSMLIAMHAGPPCVSLPLLSDCAEHGASGPAAQALQHARSHEPAVPAIWEAMADVAALSPSGRCTQLLLQPLALVQAGLPLGLVGLSTWRRSPPAC